MSNAVKDILQTERAADAIIAKAQQDRELEIVSAKQKALQLIEQGNARIEARLESQLQAQRRRLDAEREKILQQATIDAEALARNAKGKIGRAVELALRKFEQELG